MKQLPKYLYSYGMHNILKNYREQAMKGSHQDKLNYDKFVVFVHNKIEEIKKDILKIFCRQRSKHLRW